MYNLNDENPVSSKVPDDFTDNSISSKFENKEIKKEVYKYQVPEEFVQPRTILVEKKGEPMVGYQGRSGRTQS
tara:strand:- start:1102 stop:1320 length:219 start_codon:yes stop_codon:yes gene_type:complete